MASFARGILQRLFNREFRPADVAQQLVGGFLLAGPFVVTEEVWVLAGHMSAFQWAVVVAMVFAIGWGALYRADSGRDTDDETEVAGIPYRFVTLMFVSFGSVLLLALSFAAPETFEAGMFRTAKAVSIGAVFAVVGAATADSVF
ncbi:DUF2391 family protein [Halolamina salifodinae]|uniref:Putative membrane protein n=1 Tax=Halolamina salifodinae TaxID=1202767 RepID=A0A8T4GZU6_9EURY|nr:DUF2391 family protein [Halolamina salifodinae]MBP1987643.1 putative membrane protein [Halolamina salifodinae]